MLNMSIETVPHDLLAAFAWETVIKLDLTAVLSINRPWNRGNLHPFDHGSQRKTYSFTAPPASTKPHYWSERHVNYQLKFFSLH